MKARCKKKQTNKKQFPSSRFQDQQSSSSTSENMRKPSHLSSRLRSSLCLPLYLPFLESTEELTHVRRPSEAFTCIFTAQPWKRLKQACDVSFTLRRLVFCFAEELKMLPVAMDTFLHWSCCRCYKPTLIINVSRGIVVFLFTEPVAKLTAVESPRDDHFGPFNRESRPPTPPPGSIVTCTDGHFGSKTPRWCRPSR